MTDTMTLEATLMFFRSVIECGEQWTPACDQAYEEAMTSIKSRDAAVPVSVPDGWRKCYSAIIKNLAAIVDAPQTDAQCEAEVIPRDPVMANVTNIRWALDEFNKESAAPHATGVAEQQRTRCRAPNVAGQEKGHE